MDWYESFKYLGFPEVKTPNFAFWSAVVFERDSRPKLTKYSAPAPSKRLLVVVNTLKKGDSTIPFILIVNLLGNFSSMNHEIES